MASGARGDAAGVRMGLVCFPWMKKLQEKNDVPEGLQRKRVWTDHKPCHLFTYVCMHMCVCVCFLCMHVYVYMLSIYVCVQYVCICMLSIYVRVYICMLSMYVHMRVCIYVCIVYMYVCVYVCVYVFETGCSYVTLAVLKLTMRTRLASNSQEICLPLLSK